MTASKPPAEGTPNVARWTASDATYHPNGGFVAIMDYLDLQRELQAERQRCEGLVKERAEILNVKSVEGLTSSEWLLRTAKAESRAASAEKDAARLDWLEDITKCYWVTIQTQPSAKRVFSGQGLGIRAAIDAASGEAG